MSLIFVTVKLKGRVACGIHTYELILTELVLSNILTTLRAEEVAALLSSLVFQAKTQVEPTFTPVLERVRSFGFKYCFFINVH